METPPDDFHSVAVSVESNDDEVENTQDVVDDDTNHEKPKEEEKDEILSSFPEPTKDTLSKQLTKLASSDDRMYADHLHSVNQRAEQLSRENGKNLLNPEDLWHLAQQDIAGMVNDSANFSSTAMIRALSRQQDTILELVQKVDSLSTKGDKIPKPGVTVDQMVRRSDPSNADVIHASVPRLQSPRPPISSGFDRPIQSTSLTPTVTPITDLGFHTPNTSNITTSSGTKRVFNFSAEEDPRYKKKLMDAESFKGDGSQSWESYLNQFLVISHHNRWTKDEAGFQLKRAMKGKAAEFLFDDPSGANVFHTFESLVEVLEERFGSLDNPSQDWKELRQRKKKKGETWKEMAQDILQKCRRLYTNDERAMQREAVQAFIRGIPDKFRVAAAATNAKSLNELVQVVKNMCATDDLDELSCTTVPGRVNLVDSNTSAPKQNFVSVDGKTVSNYSSKITCYGCGQKGHIRRNCPNKQSKCGKCRGWGHDESVCPTVPNSQGNDKGSQ